MSKARRTKRLQNRLGALSIEAQLKHLLTTIKSSKQQPIHRNTAFSMLTYMLKTLSAGNTSAATLAKPVSPHLLAQNQDQPQEGHSQDEEHLLRVQEYMLGELAHFIAFPLGPTVPKVPLTASSLTTFDELLLLEQAPEEVAVERQPCQLQFLGDDLLSHWRELIAQGKRYRKPDSPFYEKILALLQEPAIPALFTQFAIQTTWNWEQWRKLVHECDLVQELAL